MRPSRPIGAPLPSSPGNAHDYNNLGSAFRRLNKIDEAAAQYQRALEVKPDYAEAHNNLGNILQDQGDLSRAEWHFGVRCPPGRDMQKRITTWATYSGIRGDYLKQ